MDDHLKITALMIYYKHWGNEQNKIRKSLEGVRQFQELYEEYGFTMRMSCRSYLKRHQRRTLYCILNILMTNLGGGFQPIDMLPDHNNRTRGLMIHLLRDSKIVVDDTYLNLMGFGFTEMDALSVDAIIALV